MEILSSVQECMQETFHKMTAMGLNVSQIKGRISNVSA
jgi:hypothetical protein